MMRGQGHGRCLLLDARGFEKGISPLHILEMVLFSEAEIGERTGFDTRLVECFGAMRTYAT
jgi:hypothetical protein